MSVELVYIVQAGDTLSAIAASIRACAGVTEQSVKDKNPDINENDLQVGQLILIPHSSGDGALAYTICAGDTLWAICNHINQCEGVTVADIVAENPAVKPDLLSIHDRLNIPAAMATAEPSWTLTSTADVMGFWDWTYSSAAAPQNATLSIAFSGYTDVQTVLNNAANTKGSMVGTHFICFGGGNNAGAFDIGVLDNITDAIKAGQLQDYQGVAFDIETGAAELADGFKGAFAAAKAAGLQVLVTVSHSAPFGISDASTLMMSLLADANIDYISPQLYTDGTEDKNNYDIANGFSWENYKGCKAAVVPSIVKAAYHPSAQEYFAKEGVTLSGYIQWQQTDESS